MVGAEKKSLYDAATKGELATLQQLLTADPYLVGEVFPFSRCLLHIATMHENLVIVEELMERNKKLAWNLDSEKSSPLHIAAAQGNLEIAKKLLEVAPETRWWRDSHDMNPVHIAAMKGHVEVLTELLQPDSFPAMERVHRGQTVLHLCVKHGQLLALKVLAKELGELVYAKDDDGETILHLAVRCNQFETIEYLVEENKILKQTPNSMGKTALDILCETPPGTPNRSRIKRILITVLNRSLIDRLPKMTDMTMVVVVLIATMAFQAVISPPGGVWQADTSLHRSGEAVMASTHPKVYKHFIRANTTAFLSSLITIVLISTGLPSERSLFLSIALYAMWMSLASIAVSYGACILVIAPNTETKSLTHVIVMVVVLSVSVIGAICVLMVIDVMGKFSQRRMNRLLENVGVDAGTIRMLNWWSVEERATTL